MLRFVYANCFSRSAQLCDKDFEPLALLFSIQYLDVLICSSDVDFELGCFKPSHLSEVLLCQLCLSTCLLFDHASFFSTWAKDPVQSAVYPALLSRARLVRRRQSFSTQLHSKISLLRLEQHLYVIKMYFCGCLKGLEIHINFVDLRKEAFQTAVVLHQL